MSSVAERVLPIALAFEWRSKATLFREHEEAGVAIAYERCASELEGALDQEADTVLTLQDAAEISGYSADHLGRLVREGKLPNAGREGAPRIRVRDLPRKADGAASEVATEPRPCEISNAQIVQSIIEKEG